MGGGEYWRGEGPPVVSVGWGGYKSGSKTTRTAEGEGEDVRCKAE